jgi:hypothetical protein
MKPCRTAPFVLMAPQQMQVIPVAVSLRQHCLAAPPPICHPWCRSVELPGRDE